MKQFIATLACIGFFIASPMCFSADSESKVIGVWESAPDEVSTGYAVSTWTLTDDGKYRIDLFFPEMDFKAPPQTGKYYFEDGELVLFDTAKDAVFAQLVFRFEDDDTLYFVESDEIEFKYLRKK